MSYAQKVEAISSLFDGLEGVDGEFVATGAPLEIPLDRIEEDPGQPRKRFAEAELEELAASIRVRGVRQAITVTPRVEGGRHRILYGARRYRAALRAGLVTIPAVVRDASPDDAYDQMIENIQREDLTSAEIAAFVLGRVASGERKGDIARKLGKDQSYVALYAAVGQMPAELRGKLETSPIRGVYELFQAWRTQPDAVLEFCRSRDSFTRAEAVAFAQTLKRPAMQPEPDPAGPERGAGARRSNMPAPAPDSEARHEDRSPPAPPRLAQPIERAVPCSLDVLISVDGRHGRLLLDALAAGGSDHARVVFEGGAVAEVPVGDLRIIAVRHACP